MFVKEVIVGKFYTNVQQIAGKISVRGYNNGRRFSARVNFEPELFVVARDNKTQTETWTNIHGIPLAKIEFSSIRDMKDFVERYKDVSNFESFGQTNPVYAYISKEFSNLDWQFSDIKTSIIDIEVASENGFPQVEQASEEITAISVMDYHTKKIVTYGCGEYIHDPKIGDVVYKKARNERDLLQTFLTDWSENYPDIVSGWNIQLFDLPYLVNRIVKILGESIANTIAPWGIKERKVLKFGREQTMYDLGGIATLDYLDLYRKFTYSIQESYSLNYICSVELGEQKISYDEYENFHQFYKQNWQKFIEYNIRDTNLVYRLERKLRMLELACTMAYDAKINYEDIYSQTKFWDNVIYNHLLQKKIAIPPKTVGGKSGAFEGAFVKTPKVGFYKWVVSFDATSLYPSLILQYNISPDTVMEQEFDRIISVADLVNKTVKFGDLATHNIGVAANGVCFDNSKKGFFVELVEKFMSERTLYKKRMIETQKKFEATKDPTLEEEISRWNVYQMARKISMNSLYGAVGSAFFRYFSVRQAEAVTLSGQMMIQVVEKAINEYFRKVMKDDKDYVIYCDTDSVYIALDSVIEKMGLTDHDKIISFIDKLCETKVGSVLAAACKEVAEYTNAFQNKISFKRESIADVGFWTGKKRYALRVWNSEGVSYKDPKLKIMGIEVVRSSTPEFVRKKLKETINVIMNGNESSLWSFIRKTEEEFYNLSPEDISFPRSVSGMNKYHNKQTVYSKGTPIQVRASLLYNGLLEKHGLGRKYTKIQEGDKIKFIYLKKPNPINENIMAFSNKFPPEFNLVPYIDYETMFQKTYLEPLSTILDSIGWTPKQVSKIDSLFD